MTSSQLLLIFDMDGTIIQSKIDYMGMRDRLKEILQDIVNEEEYQKIRQAIYTILELVLMIKERDSSGEIYKKAWEIVEKYELKGYEEAFVEEGVLETLRKLKKKGHILVIYTNNSRKITDFALPKYNFNNIFEYVLTRDEVEHSKPNPEGIFFLMQKFQKETSSTIFIGDSWVDAETALNAKIEFIYYGSEGAPGTRRKKIDSSHIISSMTELLNLY